MADLFDVVVSGHLCLDLIPGMGHVSLKEMSTPGRLVETEPIHVSTGGAVSNTGLALHRLGVNVRLLATVGGDLIGQLILNYLSNRDSQLAEFVTPLAGEASSSTVVLSPEQADRTFLHCTGTNRTFGSDNVDFDLVARTRIFHLGYPPLLPRLVENQGEQLSAIFRQAKAVGAVTSLDTAMPDPNAAVGRADWQAILGATLPYVDVFIPSLEEILFMLRRTDFDRWSPDAADHVDRAYLSALADELLAHGPAIVGFKLGEMGMYVKTAPANRFEALTRLRLDAAAWGAVELWSPAFQVDVVGTTGAGDSAYAGFLTALIHELPPQDALRWACAVGACNVEAADSNSGVRSWEATGRRMEAGWLSSPVTLPGF
jgi:sugar/nucleoside kinase (ribokinase family)